MDSKNFDPIDSLVQAADRIKRLYIADLEAMSDQMLRKSYGGKARSGYDMTYEVISVYNRFSEILRTQSSETAPLTAGWAIAPAAFQVKNHAQRELQKAVEEFNDTLLSYKGNHFTDTYDFPARNIKFTPYEMAQRAMMNMFYHSGQLNFMQTIEGDDERHA